VSKGVKVNLHGPATCELCGHSWATVLFIDDFYPGDGEVLVPSLECPACHVMAGKLEVSGVRQAKQESQP
jgi:hypothetical protein